MTRAAGSVDAPARQIFVRLILLLTVVSMVLVLVPSQARAQATRTWVSGVGDDANPCSRTAPCKSFAGALSKTAAGGEINVLDPGGFGGVTITKSITINGHNSLGGVLTNIGNAITINGGTTTEVTLRGLDINGLDAALSGIKIVSAKSVKIVDNEIYNFTRSGVDVASTTIGTKVLVANNDIFDNAGAAVMVTPPHGASAKVTVRNNTIADNGCGVVATQYGPDPSFNFASGCGTAPVASVTAVAIVNSFNNLITESAGAAIFSRGSLATSRIGSNHIVNNSVGLQALDGGNILSWGGNMLAGNGTPGAPTGATIPTT